MTKCFDNIDHDVLLGLLAKRIADEEFLALIRNWLSVDVLEFRDLIPTEVGVPQGESISPLLANVYLDPLDRHLEVLGIPFVRYADDFVIFAETRSAPRTHAAASADFLRDVLHLALKPAKTFYVPVAEGFDFLGFRITDTSLVIAPDRSNTLLQHLSALIRELTDAGGAFDKIAQCLSRFNSIIRGWRNYFLFPGEPALATQLKELDNQTDQISFPSTCRTECAKPRLAVPGTPLSGRFKPMAARPPASPHPMPRSLVGGTRQAAAPEAPSVWMLRRRTVMILILKAGARSTQPMAALPLRLAANRQPTHHCFGPRWKMETGCMFSCTGRMWLPKMRIWS